MPIKRIEDRLSSYQTATFSQRLQNLMSKKVLSQSDVARAVGYSPTGVWNWLQGNSFPRAETLSALAGFLGVTEDWLREGDMPESEASAVSNQVAASETIAEKVERLRAEIAGLTGYDPDRVRLTLEFGAP